ncbi:MAG: hypothetical protein WCK34_00345 [Bacteroidota bacterium]
MKKLAVIAVLTLFLVNTIGCYIVFRYNQYLIQQEMIARIRCGIFHENIVTLKILNPERDPQFRRIKDSEFSYFGRMYDQVAERKTGDTSVFFCLQDTREDDLLADYSQHLRRTGNSSHQDNPMLTLLYTLFTQALIPQHSPVLQGDGITFHFPVSAQVIIPVYLAPFAPPPELS